MQFVRSGVLLRFRDRVLRVLLVREVRGSLKVGEPLQLLVDPCEDLVLPGGPQRSGLLLEGGPLGQLPGTDPGEPPLDGRPAQRQG